MSDIIARRSPIDHLLDPGDYFSTGHEPGVLIEERRNVVQLQLIVQKNKINEVASSLSGFVGRKSILSPTEGARHQGLFICATGPLEYWILAEDRSASQVASDLLDVVGETASIFDQSEGRFVIRLAGKHTVDVLAKGTSLDLHSQAFPAQGATHTVIEHMPALVATRADPPCCDISVPTSYAASFIAWLFEAAREYGYLIHKPKT